MDTGRSGVVGEQQGTIVRAVTEEEVDHYRAKGWVKLEQLIPEDVVRDVLRRAEEILDPDHAAPVVEVGESTKHAYEKVVPRDSSWWRDYHNLARQDPFFTSIAFSPAMTHNVRALQGTTEGVRFNIDLVSCKRAGFHEGNGPTPYHQDFPAFPFDRPLNLVFWIALDDVEPEQGAMRFCEGSHLGPVWQDVYQATSLLDHDPSIAERFPLSAPLRYRAGDATVHHGVTIHGGPANTTTRHRWSYHVAYFSDAIRYSGAPSPRFDGLGLVVGEPIDHPRFPLLPE